MDNFLERHICFGAPHIKMIQVSDKEFILKLRDIELDNKFEYFISVLKDVIIPLKLKITYHYYISLLLLFYSILFLILTYFLINCVII